MIEGDIANPQGRTVLTLSEAAALVSCSVDALLSKGARGELRICARVPNDTVVYSTNKSLIDLADPTLAGLDRKLREDHAFEISALAAHDIQMVVLQQSDCASAISQGVVYQSRFAAGVRVEATGIPTVVEPLAAKGAEGILGSRPFRLFACYPSAVDPNNCAARKSSAPVRLTLTLDAMRIIHTDLASLESLQNEPVRFDIGFVEEAYMPRSLVKLYEVAMLHWNPHRTGWTDPKPAEVRRSLLDLRDEHGKQVFSDNMAQAAVFILRETFQHWNQVAHDLRKLHGVTSPFEALVVVASAWQDGVDEKSDALTALQYRKKPDAIKYFKKCKIVDSYLDGAWVIATPPEARRPGRRPAE
jgi:hypothetical protein